LSTGLGWAEAPGRRATKWLRIRLSSRLAAGSTLTRQAITKHLRVLESAGIVSSIRVGRVNLFAFRPEPLHEIQSYLERVSRQWEEALGRLKSFVER
jgi:DNA-binding transcriptional ArsR family regulator